MTPLNPFRESSSLDLDDKPTHASAVGIEKLNTQVLDSRPESGEAALQQIDKTNHNVSVSDTLHDNVSAEQSDQSNDVDFKTALKGSCFLKNKVADSININFASSCPVWLCLLLPPWVKTSVLPVFTY